MTTHNNNNNNNNLTKEMICRRSTYEGSARPRITPPACTRGSRPRRLARRTSGGTTRLMLRVLDGLICFMRCL